MKGYILPGLLGLFFGMILRWTVLSRPDGLRSTLALRRSHACRSALYAIGAGTALTALLCWLAVIDVDGIVVLPLSAGALIGGAVFGIAAALAGYTPLTAFAGIGGGRILEALCTVAGCLAGAFLLPLLETPLSALRSAPPYSAATLFRVTLDEPYLLGGSFLGQGCAGLLLMTIAVCIPSNRMARPAKASAPPAPEPQKPPRQPSPIPVRPPAHARLPGPPRLLRLPAPKAPSAEPEAAPEETFVAALPGEEPLVVDTAMEPDDPVPDAPMPEA